MRSPLARLPSTPLVDWNLPCIRVSAARQEGFFRRPMMVLRVLLSLLAVANGAVIGIDFGGRFLKVSAHA